MNKIRKILSVIPILSCICVLSLTTHAAENQNKNYLSDLRVYAGVESKENIIKDFKPDKLEYSIVVPNEKVSVGAKMSENVPENSKIVSYYTCHMFGYSWPDNVKLENSDSASTDISAMLSDETVEGSTVEIKVGVEGNVDEDIQEDIQTYMIYVHREGTKSALLTTKLEDLPGVSALTLADKNAVVEARATYNELTDAQKELMAPSLVRKLTDSEAKPTTKPSNPQVNTVAVKKGTTFIVKGYKYRVTSNLVKNPTVTVVGYKNKKLAKVNVVSAVNYKKVNFKVTAIGNKAFKNQKKTKSIVIGKNVKTIGTQAFAGDSKVKKIKVKSTVLSKVGSKAFTGIDKKAIIKVPAKQLKSYKKMMKNKGQKKTVKITK